MVRVKERVVEIPVEDSILHAVYHDGGADAQWGMVFCDPFAEEKKCAHRVLVETARTLAAAKFSCLRFDYRGCGDSPGRFEDYGPTEWVEDIAAAARYMRQQPGIRTVGALGLRLGATMAMQASELDNVFDFALLWEPVVNGQHYLKLNLRRSLIKAMMTDGEQFAGDEVRKQHDQAEVVDFDGYQVTQATRERIAEIDLVENRPQFAGPALILNLSSRDQVANEYRELAEEMANAEAAGVVQEPFWNRIGLVSSKSVVEATALWLAELQGQTPADSPTPSRDKQQ